MNKLLWMAVLAGVAYAWRRQSPSRAAVQRERDERADAAYTAGQSDALDDALRDSFPASDPPSLATPHEHAHRPD